MSEFLDNPDANDATSDVSKSIDTHIPTEDAESRVKDFKLDEKGDIAIDPYIADDIAYIREFVAPSAIKSLSSHDISVTIMRTAYARIQLTVIYNEGYPNVLPGIELSSPSLPFSLLRNKEKECQDKARQALAAFKAGELTEDNCGRVCSATPGPGLVEAIYSTIHSFIHTNMFVPCWKEMKQLIAFCKDSSIDNADAAGTADTSTSASACSYKLSFDEKLGHMTLRMRNKEYFVHVKVKVPEEYPEEGIKIEVLSPCAFPLDMIVMFRAQAEEIVRRCEAGFPVELAVSGSGPQEKLTDLTETQMSVANKKAGFVKPSENIHARQLDANGIKSIKHDMLVLRQIKDIREATVSQTKPFQYEKHATAERKEARKLLRRLASAESEKDREEEEAIRAAEEAEMEALMRLQCSENATPSLLPTTKFLIEGFIGRMPRELCQACQKTLMPVNPQAPALTNPGHKNRPVRVFCGHWLHHACLDVWLTTPPFAKQCPVCSRRIWHPDWPHDVKQLEKAWAKKEETERDKNDIASMMGF